MIESLRRPHLGFVSGIAASVAAVALVTGVVALAEHAVPTLSLGVLYVFAVLPIAVGWGLAYAIPVALASMLAFNFFFLPPRHSFTLAEGENWFALAVFVATAIVVSGLAASARRRALDAEQREQEAALLADVAGELLGGTSLDEEVGRIAARAAPVLGVSSARIVLAQDAHSSRDSGSPHQLEVDGRVIATLYTPPGEEPAFGPRRRLLPALASLLGIAGDRERLAREVLETETLRHSDLVKTAVIQTVSHDLRTPLATIQAALDGLEGGVVVLSDADRRELLETIRLEHARLKRLVENLLDLSRLQAGSAAPMLDVWPVDDLVSQALDAVADVDRVEVVLPEELPNVRVDAAQIQRVLVNLIENALRFSPPTDPVMVRINATRKEAIIRVVDRGPGIPEADFERIFEPFHRAGGSADSAGPGLGLAIARGFASANGGRLWVESRRGQGASFALALPLAPQRVEVHA